MNIELIKQFSSMCQQLKENGVLNVRLNEIHVTESILLELGNLQVANRQSEKYPFEVFTIIDGVRVFDICNEEDLKQFPELYKEVFSNEH